uniref:Uncharacterized protein n=1 Tax=Gracilaria edulis TaxID=172966 RepID=A0A6C0A991_9FLOR|nr:hypothetical protein [Gracilaria edulis]QHS70609.1 hypothetical protein [Gracilaria edulis]UAD85615.1 Preprotein translocase SecG subunit [Gracilaria edulis]
MKVLWYVSGIFSIVLILINNPKFTSLGGFSNQLNSLNFTRSTQKNLQITILTSICLFLIFNILYVFSFDIY